MSEHDHEVLGEVLRSSTPGFEPGFADRVMSRLDAQAAAQREMSLVMSTQFRRWAPLGLAAGLALAAFNVSQAADTAGQSTVDALLGLEPVSLSHAYTIEVPGMNEPGVAR